jgi:hypothetical protein
MGSLFFMRRGRDSNSRGRLNPASLAVRCFRPLSHLSVYIYFCKFKNEEAKRFELLMGLPMTVFKTVAFNRSATLPNYFFQKCKKLRPSGCLGCFCNPSNALFAFDPLGHAS